MTVYWHMNLTLRMIKTIQHSNHQTVLLLEVITIFNTYRGGDTNIKVNAVNGTIVKNFKESFFLRFEIGSSLENRLFSKNPKLAKHYSDEYPVVVIQSMIIGDKLMVAEVMWKEDFDAMFEADKN